MGSRKWRSGMCANDLRPDTLFRQAADEEPSARTPMSASRQAHGNRRHGESGTPLYQSWTNLRRRCYNPNHAGFKNYGGRGIRVCDAWVHSYEAFRDDVQRECGPRPLGHSLDRINNDGHYEPGNVRWSNRSQQARNQRRGKRGRYIRSRHRPP